MNQKALTLMEVLIVVVITGIVAGFGVVSYRKSIVKAVERDAILNLTMIQGANKIYRAKQGSYWDTSGNTVTDLNTINQELETNIIANDVSYSYAADLVNNPDAFAAYAAWNIGRQGEFRIRVNETSISATNPCCDLANSCLTLSNCP